MLEQIGDEALVDRLIVLDYELSGGPKTGVLSAWRSNIRCDNDHQCRFIERMCALAHKTPRRMKLTDEQKLDLVRFSASIYLLLDVIDLHEEATKRAA